MSNHTTDKERKTIPRVSINMTINKALRQYNGCMKNFNKCGIDYKNENKHLSMTYVNELLETLRGDTKYIDELQNRQLNTWDKLNLYCMLSKMVKPAHRGGTKHKNVRKIAKQIQKLTHIFNHQLDDPRDEYNKLTDVQRAEILKKYEMIIKNRGKDESIIEI